ncbi:MAG TPA: hypothetical protein VL793_07975 [Patescibacteria group bacterium]|nr:hypothetical protein [Patescibacteria group bacterium]
MAELRGLADLQGDSGSFNDASQSEMDCAMNRIYAEMTDKGSAYFQPRLKHCIGRPDGLKMRATFNPAGCGPQRFD